MLVSNSRTTKRIRDIIMEKLESFEFVKNERIRQITEEEHSLKPDDQETKHQLINVGVDMWLVRDNDNDLKLVLEEKPVRVSGGWGIPIISTTVFFLDNSLFPEVQSSDEEPTKVVKLVIEK